MKQRPRIYYSDAQKELMWDRWKKGDSMHAIARLFDRGHGAKGRLLVTGWANRSKVRMHCRGSHEQDVDFTGTDRTIGT